MSNASRTEARYWSTITSAPAVTPAPLRGRDESSWNTCGYFDGDTEDPNIVCEDDGCVCETTGSAMVYCSGTGDDRDCDKPLTVCWPATATPWSCDGNDCSYISCDDDGLCDDPPASETWCTEGAYTECALSTWTDISAGRLQCYPVDHIVELSFAHPDTTEKSTSSPSARTSSQDPSSSASNTSSIPSTATSTTPSSREAESTPLSPGAKAGIGVGTVVAFAIVMAILLAFFHKRRAANAENKKHTDAVISRHSTGLARAAGSADPPQNLGTATPSIPEKQADQMASPAMQPLPPSAATSTVVSPMLSPLPSPTTTLGGPHGRAISPQSSSGRLSMGSSQVLPVGTGRGYLAMPAFPPASPPDRRFSPRPEGNPHLPVPGANGQRESSFTYSSIYSFPSTLPPFSDPGATRAGQSGQSSCVEGQGPTMSSSWFQDRSSVASELDAGGTGGSVRGAAQRGVSATGAQDRRLTTVSELMGSLPGTAH